MKRTLLACALMTTAILSYGQMSKEDLAHAQAESPEVAAKMFGDIGYYMAILNRCGTPVDMKMARPFLKRFNKLQRQQLLASIGEGQARADALPPYSYVAGSSECASATAGYTNAMTSLQALLPLLSKR
jgi:hypothetical protein